LSFLRCKLVALSALMAERCLCVKTAEGYL